MIKHPKTTPIPIPVDDTNIYVSYMCRGSIQAVNMHFGYKTHCIKKLWKKTITFYTSTLQDNL